MRETISQVERRPALPAGKRSLGRDCRACEGRGPRRTTDWALLALWRMRSRADAVIREGTGDGGGSASGDGAHSRQATGGFGACGGENRAAPSSHQPTFTGVGI